MKMKKLFAILMTLSLLCGCAACFAEEGSSGSAGLGGWTINQDEISVILPDAEQAIFDQAAPEGYTLIATLATQVVAGTNYAFLARNEEGFAVIVIYNDLQGNAAVTSIAPIDVINILTAEETVPAGLIGGWTIQDTGKPAVLPTEEGEAAYETAVFAAERNLKPIALLATQLATQLVSGMNYKVLAQEDGALYVVTVYQPLEGDASITEIVTVDLLAYVTPAEAE